MRIDELVSFHLGDAAWYDGPGWYYADQDYPDEGSVGAFGSEREAREHAAGVYKDDL